MSLSSSFHSLGPAYLNEQSPNVIKLLKEGLLSKSISSEFLRLYLEAGFSSTSSDIYGGVIPLRALYTKRRILNWIL